MPAENVTQFSGGRIGSETKIHKTLAWEWRRRHPKNPPILEYKTKAEIESIALPG